MPAYQVHMYKSCDFAENVFAIAEIDAETHKRNLIAKELSFSELRSMIRLLPVGSTIETREPLFDDGSYHGQY